MKTLLVALMAICAAGAAHAQYYSTQPDGNGGYYTYGPGGLTSTTQPDGNGGYNTWINRQEPSHPYTGATGSLCGLRNVTYGCR